MSRLVSDLERLREMERDNLHMELTDVDLLELAGTVAAGFEAALRAKGLHCSVEGSACVVPGDERRLFQVVSNLMSNAVKYTGEGGHIRLVIGEQRDCGTLTVEDDGIGIPGEEQPLIFERFYRTDRSRSRKTGGVGIGLTIARAIVRAHGGEISVESREQEGSRFTVRLPKRQ